MTDIEVVLADRYGAFRSDVPAEMADGSEDALCR